jgi:hypothetical protein
LGSLLHRSQLQLQLVLAAAFCSALESPKQLEWNQHSTHRQFYLLDLVTVTSLHIPLSIYWPIMVYAIADANEYLVITGSGIEDVKITKKAWVWPFQRCSRISVLPDDYSSKKISKT